MRIVVLDLTTHPEPMLSGLMKAGQLITQWLGPALPEAEIRVIEIANHNAPMPTLDSFDGVVLSGSESGVYDPKPWMDSLRAFLLEVKTAQKPVYGICFGHQIMADTYGGKAEKSEAGTAVGACSFDMEGRAVDAHVWHKDQVTKVPPGAKITGTASHCPVGALDYDFPARSVQFHPELIEPEFRLLFERGRDVLLDGALADAAVESFAKTDVAVDLEAAETAEFFRQHVRRDTAPA